MGKTALVTGASAGLGRELARLFAADKHDLVLVARRRDRLEQVAAQLETAHGVRVWTVPDDLADPAAPERVVAELSTRAIDVEFLVNNAGFGTNGSFAELDPARELDMVRVNIAAVVHLTRLLLPAMLKKRSGRILTLGSCAGFQPGPFMAVYYASKAFVNSFSEALSFELRGTGVSATVCCPGATATEFARVAGNAKSRLFEIGAMNATYVAKHAYRAMMHGRAMAIPGLRNKLALQSLRVAPRGAVLRLSAALNQSDRAAKDSPPG